MKYEHLIGRKFIHGKADCFALVRAFYNENFGLNIPNYARPMGWWDVPGQNLYMDAFYENGFRVLSVHPTQWRPGDGVLMSIRSKCGVANHAGVFVEPNKILHHLFGRLSVVERYRGLTRNTTVAIVRHKDVTLADLPKQSINLMELLPHALRTKLAAALPPAGGPE